jgi:cytochrome c biogenesis protein CcmG/thiol:disulfide interchange protein DsbE
MTMKPLDKKQIPQVVAMAVLAVLFFGYFAVKMIMPTPAAAGSQAPAAPAAAAAAAPKTGDAQAASDPSATMPDAPPPSATLRDPFVQAISDQPAPPPVLKPVAPPAARPAVYTKPSHPSGLPTYPINILPGVGNEHGAVAGVPHPMVPAAPPIPVAAPTWVVTGVLQSGADTVAILRSGDARRFVKKGDYVDSTFRVTSVTRDAVTLRHGVSRFTLPLGGAKAVPAARTVSSPGASSAAAAPDFTLDTLAGKSVSLSSYRGHVVVLDFWASWCDWCRKGMPQVQTLAERFGPKGVAVLSINSWDKRDAMQAFVQANPQYTTTMLYDPSPEAQSVACSLFGVKGIPYTVVIDKQGRVAAAFDGYSPDGEQKLETVLTGLGVRRASPDIARAVKPRLRKPLVPRSTVLALAPRSPFSLFSRRPAMPEMAHTVHSHLTHPHSVRHVLLAAAPRSLFSFSAPALTMPLVSAPRPDRHAASRLSVCPVIRVADYRSEQAGALFPVQGHGLLPSGMPAPDFSLSTLDGQDVTLSQFRGDVVVLDFWASWDAASLKMLTWLQGLQHQAGRDRVTVLAVNSWDNKGAMQTALQGADWDMTMLFDPSVSNESIAVRSYRAPDVPTVYVIDQEGRVAGAFVGSGRNTANYIKATLAKLGAL